MPSEQKKENINQPDFSKKTKICPYCAEEIKYDAIKCRFCQSDLRVNKENSQIELKTESEKSQFGCGSAILALLIPIIGIFVGIVWLTSEEDKDRAWPMIGVSLLGFLIWVIII